MKRALDPPDEMLMLRYQQGERAAFAQLVRRHQGPLYNFALRQVRVPQQAEDVVQETFVRVVQNAAEFKHEARFTTWAVRVAVRLAYTELRRQRWRDVSLDELLASGTPIPDTAAAADAPVLDAERVRIVRALIAETLTARQQTALEAVVAGMELEEVAVRMGTNRNALYKLLHDARMRLKAALAARGLGPDDLLPE